MDEKVILNGTEYYAADVAFYMDSEQEFLDEYIRRHAEKYDGEQFDIV